MYFLLSDNIYNLPDKEDLTKHLSFGHGFGGGGHIKYECSYVSYNWQFVLHGFWNESTMWALHGMFRTWTHNSSILVWIFFEWLLRILSVSKFNSVLFFGSFTIGNFFNTVLRRRSLFGTVGPNKCYMFFGKCHQGLSKETSQVVVVFYYWPGSNCLILSVVDYNAIIRNDGSKVLYFLHMKQHFFTLQFWLNSASVTLRPNAPWGHQKTSPSFVLFQKSSCYLLYRFHIMSYDVGSAFSSIQHIRVLYKAVTCFIL